MHFYKGYWVQVKIINSDTCKLVVDVLTDNHHPVAGNCILTNRKEAKEWAESYIDVMVANAPALEAIPF